MAKLKHTLDYEVFLDYGPYSAHGNIGEWCILQFGDRYDAFTNRQGKWSVFYAGPRVEHGRYRWCFATEQDAMWFALRWSK